ncbi:MAG: glycoside hydrolase family 125 protein [Oscillospiraceae bacterium]|nr:glycoside hydrolase family 125 protein [Oscillospiraceae bacterium]
MTAADKLRARIQPMKEALAPCPGLWELFERCYLNTIETTVQQTPGDTFVITGDIAAMWLRDSTAQVLHYLRFAAEPEVSAMLEGLIARQAACILRDPYANAFNREPSDYKPYNDTPRASDWVWERKYEIDSLCYPLWLAEKYHARTGSTTFLTKDFHAALRCVVELLRLEQDHSRSPYRFERTDCPPGDTLVREGRGSPVAVTGMTWSGFRPSDDACRYGYLVPSNLFAARAMRSACVLAGLLNDPTLAAEAEALGEEIAAAVRKHGTVEHPEHGTILAYEVDGLGNANLMDDANVPSLLALPYLEVCAPEDALYQNTRRFVLSKENPYYYTGQLAAGVGSPHTPGGYIWPIALCVQAMTSIDLDEIAACLHTLLHTHGGTGFMHESFDPNAPEKFTRSWFAWANSMFGELVCLLYETDWLGEVLDRMKKL